MIDRNHPAVEALARELAFLNDGDPWPSNEELGGSPTGTRDDEFRAAQEETAIEHIGVVLPHLTAATEDNLARLRDTPAGKQLLAEGWEAACRKVIHMAWADSSDAEYLADKGNPYRTEAPSDAPEG